MSHNTQKKAAIINDMSGFGRCAITVALPIISTLKVQCCPVPTSIFSNHTAFPNYFFDD
ncbi:MAG: phosphomethylpyrimidine kinase, partial [Hungatella sp.]